MADEGFVSDIYNALLQESMRLGVGIEKLDFNLLGFRTKYGIAPQDTANSQDAASQNSDTNSAQSPNSTNTQNSNTKTQNPPSPQNSANANSTQENSTDDQAKADPDANIDFKPLSEKELSIFDDDELYLNPNLRIKQEYKMQIFKAHHKEHQLPKIKLLKNKDITKIIAQIDFSGVVFYPNIAMETLQDIYKRMIEEGFYIGIRIFDFKKDLLKALNSFKNKSLKHPKVLVEVATGVHPISPESEKLILCYKDKAAQKEGEIKQVSLIGINEGDLILRHIQPGTTRQGRNLKMEFLNPHIPAENHIEFSCSENFEAREVSLIPERVHCVEYFAKKKGFVSKMPDGKYDIENELNLSSATFKETGSIMGGLDNNITINIKSNSDLEDAVGSGVQIECETLIINGNVGSNTILKARKMQIYGNTNTSAKLYADELYISTHKGYAKAKKVDIDSLENGVVEGSIVKIKKGLGGKIDAERILMASMGANNAINFSAIMLLEQCSGTGNKITAMLMGGDLEPLKQIERRQREIPKLIEKLENAINASKGGVETLTKKIKQLQAQKLPVPNNFMQMIREYKGYTNELERLNRESAELKMKKDELVKSLQKRDEELFECKIINKGKSWEDMNVLKWKFSHQEYSFMPKRGDEAVLVYAKRHLESGDIRIEVAQEFDERDIAW